MVSKLGKRKDQKPNNQFKKKKKKRNQRKQMKKSSVTRTYKINRHRINTNIEIIIINVHY